MEDMEKELRILLLEANQSDAKLVEEELRRAGLSFISKRVETRQEFEDSLKSFSPDLVLSDYWLPTFDGLSALSMTMELSPGTPFIFVSGASGEELAVETVRCGAADYVMKIGLSRLAPAVRRALKESQEQAGRTLAEMKLKEGEERLRTILDSVQAGMVIIDRESHRVVDLNPAASDMLGLPRESVIGHVCFSYFICPADRGRCPVTDCGAGRHQAEVVLLTAGGGRLPVIKTVTPVVLDNSEQLLESFVDLSPMKKIQAELEHERAFTEGALNSMTDAFMVIDTEGRLLRWNPALNKISGYTDAEMASMSLLDFFSREEVERVRGAVEKAAEKGHAELETYLMPSRGEPIPFELNAAPLLGPNGEVTGICGIGRDISERRRVEEAQKKDRDFIFKVLDTAGVLVLVLERQGRIVLFNRTAERTTGYTFDEVKGKRIWEVFLKGSAEESQARGIFRRVIAGKVDASLETYWRTKHGDRRLISWSTALLLDASGEAEYVIATGIDVTEPRLAERALRESEERYRTVFESTGTAMCIVEADDTISFVNKEFERLSGFDAEYIQRKMKMGEFLWRGEGGGLKELLGDGAESGTQAPLHLEFRARDGVTTHVLASAALLPTRDAHIISLIDITREKRYEEDLKERAERLRDFLVVASHELRHPIAIVKGYANTLKEFLDRMSPELIQEILSDVDASTDRLTHYVEQLLDVSRVESGRFQVEREEADPKALLSRAIEDMKVIGHGDRFKTKVSRGVGTISVDPDKFVHLLAILMDNAVKFSPPDTPVEIEVSKGKKGVMISVLDRGRGIPDSDAENVFERFYQVEDVRHHSTPGMGLGLYIAREIVKAHGGRIWCEPREGGGTIFRLTLT